VAVAAAVVALLAAPRADHFTTDSESYLDVARALLAGGGLVQQVVDFWRPAVPDPLGLWPPLYPVLVAGLARVGFPVEGAAIAVSVLAWLAFAVLFHALAHRTVAPRPARVATVLALLTAPLAFASGAAWSEMLFLALAAGAWLALGDALEPPAHRGDERRRLAAAAFAGGLVGLAALTRYAGWSLAPLALGALLASRVPRNAVTVFALPAFALPGLWLARNIVVFGSPTGPGLPPATEGALAVVGQLGGALRWALVPWPAQLSGALSGLLLAALFVLATFALMIGRRPALASALALAWLATLVTLRSMVSVNPIGVRYVLPALPFLWLACVAAASWIAGRVRFAATIAGGVAAIALVLAAIGFARALTVNPAPAASVRQRALLHAELRALVGPDSVPLLSDDGHAVRSATGRAAVQLPAGAFRMRAFEAADFERWRSSGVTDAVFRADAWRDTTGGRAGARARVEARHGAWLAARLLPGSRERWTVADSTPHYVRFVLP
jgi:hypothetical protein